LTSRHFIRKTGNGRPKTGNRQTVSLARDSGPANKYVLLVLVTALLWSLGGVLIKSIDWNPIAIAGTRSLIGSVLMLVVMPKAFRSISWSSLPAALAFSATVILFVIATKMTTAANAIFLQYTAPIYIALFSPWVLKERIALQDWLLIAIAVFGIGLFFLDRLTVDSLWGILLALTSGLTYAWLTILLRRQRDASPEAAALLGNILTFLFAIPWMFPVEHLAQNAPWLLLLGVFQLGLPYMIYAVAIRHVRALDASVICMIEPVLNPIWVMLMIGEHPAPWSIVGGGIVLLTSLVRTLMAARRYA
jgi:drug/metabolite transporter (DMT)-like permease